MEAANHNRSIFFGDEKDLAILSEYAHRELQSALDKCTSKSSNQIKPVVKQVEVRVLPSTAYIPSIEAKIILNYNGIATVERKAIGWGGGTISKGRPDLVKTAALEYFKSKLKEVCNKTIAMSVQNLRNKANDKTFQIVGIDKLRSHTESLLKDPRTWCMQKLKEFNMILPEISGFRQVNANSLRIGVELSEKGRMRLSLMLSAEGKKYVLDEYETLILDCILLQDKSRYLKGKIAPFLGKVKGALKSLQPLYAPCKQHVFDVKILTLLAKGDSVIGNFHLKISNRKMKVSNIYKQKGSESNEFVVAEYPFVLKQPYTIRFDQKTWEDLSWNKIKNEKRLQSFLPYGIDLAFVVRFCDAVSKEMRRIRGKDLPCIEASTDMQSFSFGYGQYRFQISNENKSQLETDVANIGTWICREIVYAEKPEMVIVDALNQLNQSELQILRYVYEKNKVTIQDMVCDLGKSLSIESNKIEKYVAKLANGIFLTTTRSVALLKIKKNNSSNGQAPQYYTQLVNKQLFSRVKPRSYTASEFADLKREERVNIAQSQFQTIKSQDDQLDYFMVLQDILSNDEFIKFIKNSEIQERLMSFQDDNRLYVKMVIQGELGFVRLGEKLFPTPSDDQ